METSNVFSWKRFANLCRLEFITNRKLFFYSALALLVILATYFFLNSRKISASAEQNYFFYFSEFLLGSFLLFSVFIFPFFRTKPKAIAYLTLPVSFWERVLVEYFVKIVFYTAVYIAIFTLASYLASFFSGFKAMPAKPFSFMVFLAYCKNQYQLNQLTMVVVALAVYSLLFIGNVSFYRAPLVKTASILAVFLVLLFVEFRVLIQKFSSVRILYKYDNAEGYVSATIIIICLAIIIVSMLKLKEKEV
jgi:hypothetical protein